MLQLTKAIDLAQDGEEHDFVFIAKGSNKNKRRGGYKVVMKNAYVTSSNHERRKMNIKSANSGQMRWCYYCLLIEIDVHEIIL